MSPSNPENDPVQKGLHELGRQMEDGASATGATPTGEPVEPVENPVEKGLHELGRQIDEAHRSARGKKAKGDDAPRGPAHAAPKKRRSRRRTVAWATGTLLLVVVRSPAPRPDTAGTSTTRSTASTSATSPRPR